MCVPVFQVFLDKILKIKIKEPKINGEREKEKKERKKGKEKRKGKKERKKKRSEKRQQKVNGNDVKRH